MGTYHGTGQGRRPKLTKTEREAALAEIARLGRNQYAIARAVGLSQPRVRQCLRRIRERYLAAQMADRDALVRDTLEELRAVRAAAWDAWDRSRRVGEGAAGRPRPPGAKYLQVILVALRQERELLGLDAAGGDRSGPMLWPAGGSDRGR